MSKVYDPKARAYRVQFVCSYILAGRATTRTFDACLEMGDGDEVAAEVYARALKNPKLMEALPRYLDAALAKKEYERIYGAVSAQTADAMHATITGLMRENERMREALRYAAELIPTARNYFPKSIHNGDRFRLENTCAAIGKALN